MLGDGRFSVQPKRLRAVLFCNVLESGEPDVRLLHRADPVKEEGYLKFGLNIWVTDKSLQALAFSTAGTVLGKDSARLGAAAGYVTVHMPSCAWVCNQPTTTISNHTKPISASAPSSP